MTRQFATITLIGDDKAGVIARITQLLFQLGANIEALEEQVSRGRFSMTLQASWRRARNSIAPPIQRRIREAGDALEHGNQNPLRARGPATPRHPRHEGSRTCSRASSRSRPRRSARSPSSSSAAGPSSPARSRTAQGCPSSTCPFHDRAKAERRVLAVLEKHEVNFIVLARFMKILSPNFVWRWKNKIINIHPSLLPAFPGASAYRQAYERGVKIVGVTAHFVTPDLDEGPIIAQEVLRVRANEPLAGIVKRGQALETKCVLRAIRAYVTKRLDVHWGRVYS